MFAWLAQIAASGVFKIFGDTFVQPFLTAYLKSKDVDLEKTKAADATMLQLSAAILDANVRFAEIKSNYVLSVLQWWPFRLLLFCLIAVCAVRFSLAVFDSTWWWIEGCTINGKQMYGDVCSWSFPAIKGTFGDAEREFLMFFILAKPVDTAVSGALGLLGHYLKK